MYNEAGKIESMALTREQAQGKDVLSCFWSKSAGTPFVKIICSSPHPQTNQISFHWNVADMKNISGSDIFEWRGFRHILTTINNQVE